MERQILKNTLKTTSSNNGIAEYAWHYTTGEAFISIVESGVLRQATAFVPKNQRPVLWFSLNQDYEPTAAKAIMSEDGTISFGNRESTRQLGRGLVRFGLDPKRLVTWRHLKKRAGIPSQLARALEASGRAIKARPDDWLGSFDAIGIEELVVEVWYEGSWIRVPHKNT
jgi:hypothetical protein